jgi:isoprenylcysteine carboxyl methyltransferase (ICMT) family protein YpbQ
MANLLLSIFITGLAVTYLLELLDKVQLGILQKSTVNLIASMPLSLACLYVLSRHWTVTLLVSVPAATFVALVLNMYINKPTVVQQQRLPRMY